MVELWERQPRERDPAYYCKQIYIKEIKTDRTLQKVIDFIKTLPKNDNDKQKYDFKGHLIELPSLSQLQNWSKKYQWNQALTDYTNYLSRLDQEKDEERYDETNDSIKDGLEQDLKEIDEYSKELYASDYSLSTKINLKYTLARARDLTIKNLRLSHGRSTSISESNDKVKVDAELQYSGLKDLAEAFNEGKRKYLKKQ